jgi:5'-3' exonuclease
MVEVEADDALATAAAALAAEPAVGRIWIATPDKDLAQCVVGDRVVCWDRFKDVVLDEPAVHAKFGVGPASIPDYLALVGDAADGIPGLPGFGAKTAARLLARWRHLEAIPDDPTAWDVAVRGAPALAATLRDRRADAALYRTLATLRRDAAIACDPAALAWAGPDRPALATLCAELAVDPASIKL